MSLSYIFTSRAGLVLQFFKQTGGIKIEERFSLSLAKKCYYRASGPSDAFFGPLESRKAVCAWQNWALILSV